MGSRKIGHRAETSARARNDKREHNSREALIRKGWRYLVVFFGAKAIRDLVPILGADASFLLAALALAAIPATAGANQTLPYCGSFLVIFIWLVLRIRKRP